jgi:glycosyltransferase involved in cell wall biosynthesis
MEKNFGNDPLNWPGGEIKKLVIVGAPSYTSDYNSYLNEIAEESPNIIFTGFQTGKNLKQLFSNAYLYIHPSESEGLSITILEAMSFGICILISDIPENLEIIDHSGISFKTKNTNDLYDKLVHLLNSPEKVKRLGEKGKKFIKLNFNWNDIAKKTEEIYKKI